MSVGGTRLLVAERDDPLAQLLAEEPGWQTEHAAPSGAIVAGPGIGEIVVTSHQLFLAGLPRFGSPGASLRLFIRRSQDPDRADRWAASLSLLKDALAGLDGVDVSLHALTDALSEAAADALGRTVETWPGSGAPPLLDAEARIASRVQTIAIVGPDRSTGLRPSMMNWSRLRRLARLRSEGEAPDTADLVEYANRPGPAAGAAPDGPVVIVVPNGIGLGHVTRMLAVARHLQGAGRRVVFWTNSRALGLIEAAGFEVHFRPTARHLGAVDADWTGREVVELSGLIRSIGARALVYDGSDPPRYLTEALLRPGCGLCGLVWVRRAMWNVNSPIRPLEFEQACDLVVEPGELAGAVDRGPTRTQVPRLSGLSERRSTPPVILARDLDRLDRRAARKVLRLGRGRHCLVSLGGDALTDWFELKRLIRAEAARARVTLTWLKSPLAAREDADAGDRLLRRYPISPYLEAFDGVISAAGYNSFHELLLAFDRPVLFAPVLHGASDDQKGRADFAAAQGWARAVDTRDPGGDIDTFREYFADIRAGGIAPRPAAEADGAAQTADLIAGVAHRYEREGEGA